MVSVEDVKGLVTEAIRAFKIQLDSERDKIASAEITSQSAHLTGMLERTQTMVESAAANHQEQIDHVNKVSVYQEAYVNTKHKEITAIMIQLAEHKVSLDGTTKLLRSRDEEIRAAFLGKEVEFARIFKGPGQQL